MILPAPSSALAWTIRYCWPVKVANNAIGLHSCWVLHVCEFWPRLYCNVLAHIYLYCYLFYCIAISDMMLYCGAIDSMGIFAATLVSHVLVGLADIIIVVNSSCTIFRLEFWIFYNVGFACALNLLAPTAMEDSLHKPYSTYENLLYVLYVCVCIYIFTDFLIDFLFRQRICPFCYGLLVTIVVTAVLAGSVCCCAFCFCFFCCFCWCNWKPHMLVS